MIRNDVSPIYIIGRQHSGNTMMAVALDRLPDVFALKGEGALFEHLPQVEALSLENRIERITELIDESCQPRLSEATRKEITVRLLSEARKRSINENEPSGLDLYLASMEVLARKEAKSRWAQKATSYIFYVERILSLLPQAKFICLTRNPLDIAASMKRRGEGKRTFRMAWGWNVGTKRALFLRDKYPKNLMIVRYEDIVSSPEPKMRDICDFIGITFASSCLDVPHVNRSEAKYTMRSVERGISQSRRFYFVNVLEPAEQIAVRTFVNTELMDELYPEIDVLLKQGRIRSLPMWLPVASRMIVRGLASTLSFHIHDFLSRPAFVVDRLYQRLR